MMLALSATSRALLFAILLVGVVIVAAIVLTAIRRRFLREAMETTPATLSLHEIRTLFQRGEITEEEFDQLRSAALAGWGVSTKAEQAGAESSHPTAQSQSSGRTENPLPPMIDES